MENVGTGTHGPEETVDMSIAVLRKKIEATIANKKVHPRTGHEGPEGE
jgi:hypothetical protein